MSPAPPRSGNPAIPQRNRGALLIWPEKNTQWRAPQPERKAVIAPLPHKGKEDLRETRGSSLFSVRFRKVRPIYELESSMKTRTTYHRRVRSTRPMTSTSRAGAPRSGAMTLTPNAWRRSEARHDPFISGPPQSGCSRSASRGHGPSSMPEKARKTATGAPASEGRSASMPR